MQLRLSDNPQTAFRDLPLLQGRGAGGDELRYYHPCRSRNRSRSRRRPVLSPARVLGQLGGIDGSPGVSRRRLPAWSFFLASSGLEGVGKPVPRKSSPRIASELYGSAADRG